MNTPIMVTLDRDAMSGYLLNVLGTDQIHDFCGGRLTKAIPIINQSFLYVNGKRKNNKLNDSSNNQTKRQNTQKNGGDSSVIPTDYEVIEQQCLELIHIFVNTIIEDNTTNDSVNNTDNFLSDSTLITGGRNSEESANSLVTESKYIHNSSLDNGKSQQSVSSLVKPMDIGKVTEHTINSNQVYDELEGKTIDDNVIKWGKRVKSKIESFINTVPNNINDSLNYVCIDDIINIFTSYLDKLPNISTSEDVHNFEYFITLYAESMNYFIRQPLRNCYNNTQPQTGGTQETKQFKDVIRKMIKQMVFTFCDISGNCGDWTATPNWKCFEIGLLNNKISKVESTSSEWIRNQIYSNKSNINNKFKFIQSSKGLFDVRGNLFCKLKIKKNLNHIIVNSANLKDDWKQFILKNYPSFIDSQSSEGTKDELLEKMEKYDCGFRDPSNKYYYKIIMTPSLNEHTISIGSNNNKFKFTKTFSDFKTYNKETTNIEYATRWKDVTLCVALINAFENMSPILKEKNINKLSVLIGFIENSFINTINKNETLNITKLFYSFSLFKGLGDISQEMTAVIKYGGGNKNNSSLTNKNNYEAFDTSGNALRLFLARDQLSANRFILTLNYGLQYGLKRKNDNNINSKAYGGYLNVSNCNPKDMYLIEPIQPLPKTTTGGNKKHSRKYKNSKRKRKNHTKNKRNKHYKTYKLYKKNT